MPDHAVPLELHVEPMPRAHMPRLPVLDGWRAVSILAVLQCHLGPYGLETVTDITQGFGLFGMALFFCLSGFLITSALYFNPHVRVFAIRRLFRIVPAAWLFLLLTLPFLQPHISKHAWLANFVFVTNHVPFLHIGWYLVPVHQHLWSLSVEVEFYVAIALLFAVLRRRTFPLLPVLTVLDTALCVYRHETHNIRTEFRVVEILAGATLAYLFHSPGAGVVRRVLAAIPPIVPLLLLMLSCSWNPRLAAIEYARPYLAMLLVGASVCQPEGRWARVLSSPVLAYIAAISYALYLWHPVLGWGETIDVNSVPGYLLRKPLSLLLLVGVAHLSTYYVEKPFIRWGNRLAKRLQDRAAPDHAAA